MLKREKWFCVEPTNKKWTKTSTKIAIFSSLCIWKICLSARLLFTSIESIWINLCLRLCCAFCCVQVHSRCKCAFAFKKQFYAQQKPFIRFSSFIFVHIFVSVVHVRVSTWFGCECVCFTRFLFLFFGFVQVSLALNSFEALLANIHADNKRPRIRRICTQQNTYLFVMLLY